ncbi:MAG: HRDC domain-containing protein [Acidobacteriota bacterium]|jgi:ribonuclease D
MLESIKYSYLVDPDEVRAIIPDFTGQRVIGLDTETFFDPETRQNRLSLLQLASPTGRVVVIDGLTAGIEIMRPLIEQPEVVMAAHNARFDEGVLRRAGFDPDGFVDTLKLSRRTLTLDSHSLAAISEHLFNLRLDKTYQRSDWSRRPLSREQLYYAALDAVVALHLFQELELRLQREQRWEIEFSRARVPNPRELAELAKKKRSARRRRSDPLTLRPLTAEERRLVVKFHLWRQQQARAEHLPLYMICQDRTFEHLVIARPDSVDGLLEIFGLGPSRIEKYGQILLEILHS